MGIALPYTYKLSPRRARDTVVYVGVGPVHAKNCELDRAGENTQHGPMMVGQGYTFGERDRVDGPKNDHQQS